MFAVRRSGNRAQDEPATAGTIGSGRRGAR